MAIFTNQATLLYNGTTVNSNTVTGNLVEVLAATKTAVDNNYSANEDVTYIVSITNSGAVPFTGITVTDNLGAYTFDTQTVTPLDYVDGSLVYYQNGVLQATPTVTQTQPLTVTGLTVPPGGNAILVYEVRTNGFAPLATDSTITNEAVITATGLSTPVTAEETISVLDSPNLSITKSLSPVNVTENSEITYTFTIQNTGNTPAGVGDDIVIADIFNPILSNISVTVDATPLPATSYTYNEATGEFATIPGSITVPAATFTQDPTTGAWIITPGVTTITIVGTV